MATVSTIDMPRPDGMSSGLYSFQRKFDKLTDSKQTPRHSLTTLPLEIILLIFDALIDARCCATCLGLTCTKFFFIVKTYYQHRFVRLSGWDENRGLPIESIYSWFTSTSQNMEPKSLFLNRDVRGEKGSSMEEELRQRWEDMCQLSQWIWDLPSPFNQGSEWNEIVISLVEQLWILESRPYEIRSSSLYASFRHWSGGDVWTCGLPGTQVNRLMVQRRWMAKWLG
ncbi:hypothetical protein DL98DRAFT_538015 [Cadophora sp. DSE1049]|nr:hypothetical protein DL98DRAFT_538015 [Cadophora sp. DSE1049]